MSDRRPSRWGAALGRRPLILAALAGAAVPLRGRSAEVAPDRIFLLDAVAGRISLVDPADGRWVRHLPTRPAVHGAPVWSADARFVTLASADGWVSRIDLDGDAAPIHVQLGSGPHHLAVSGDGRWILAGAAEQARLVWLNDRLEPVRRYATTTIDGQQASPVAAVVDAALRRSFVVALRDIPELWEISYDPRAEDLYDGLVHDYRMGEGIPRRGYQGVRRTRVPEPLSALLLDPAQAEAIGPGASLRPHRINLDVRRWVGNLPLPAQPALTEGAMYARPDGPAWVVPGDAQGQVQVLDARTWGRVASVSTGGPGRFVRAHPASPVLWAESPQALNLIDARRWTLSHRIPAEGGTWTDVAFSASGRVVRALLSAAVPALVWFDAQDGSELRRIPVPGGLQLFQPCRQDSCRPMGPVSR